MKILEYKVHLQCFLPNLFKEIKKFGESQNTSLLDNQSDFMDLLKIVKGCQCVLTTLADEQMGKKLKQQHYQTRKKDRALDRSMRCQTLPHTSVLHDGLGVRKFLETYSSCDRQSKGYKKRKTVFLTNIWSGMSLGNEYNIFMPPISAEGVRRIRKKMKMDAHKRKKKTNGLQMVGKQRR